MVTWSGRSAPPAGTAGSDSGLHADARARLAVDRRHQRVGRDRTLAAIMLTGQVVPHLLSPELLLLAVEEVTRRWQHYLSQWDNAVPAADRPAAPPMRLVEFVDRYCVDVEHGSGPDGCTGRCGPGRAGRGCDPDACAAGAWQANVATLAARAGAGHPAHALLGRAGIAVHRDVAAVVGGTE